MRIARTFVMAACLLTLLIGPSSAEQPKVRLENLFQEHLASELASGLEVVVSEVELPPHTTLDMHWHPGEEFVYLAEGHAKLVFADLDF